MGVLFDKMLLEQQLETLPEWKQAAYKYFASMLADDNTYPCVPARHGFLKNRLRFCFIDDPRKESSIKVLATALKDYGSSSRKLGNYTSLVVFFQTPKEIYGNYTVEDYRSLFWNVLNRLAAIDKHEWPKDIPEDPTHHKWEFCFNGEPYFSFCATPRHKQRKSRYFPYFCMAFQPRWVFASLNGSTSFGRKMKNIIRKRLVNYDGFPGHPDLKWYGEEDNHEWKQYFLSDDDSSPTQCPFKQMKQKLSTFLH